MQIIIGNFIFDGVIDGVNMVGFYKSEDGDGDYLLVQWRGVYDDQDVRLGQNNPYIEVCGQELSQYAGVDGVNVSRDKLLIKFNKNSQIGRVIDGVEVSFFEEGDGAIAAKKLAQIFM